PVLSTLSLHDALPICCAPSAGYGPRVQKRPTGAWLQSRGQMTMITAPELEVAVLVLGMAILLAEAFVTKIDKRVLAFVAIAGLADRKSTRLNSSHVAI